MICSICQRDIDVVGTWDKGHNAQPVNEGRCCTFCNCNVVIPARVEQWIRSQQNSLETKTGASSPKQAEC